MGDRWHHRLSQECCCSWRYAYLSCRQIGFVPCWETYAACSLCPTLHLWWKSCCLLERRNPVRAYSCGHNNWAKCHAWRVLPPDSFRPKLPCWQRCCQSVLCFEYYLTSWRTIVVFPACLAPLMRWALLLVSSFHSDSLLIIFLLSILMQLFSSVLYIIIQLFFDALRVKLQFFFSKTPRKMNEKEERAIKRHAIKIWERKYCCCSSALSSRLSSRIRNRWECFCLG